MSLPPMTFPAFSLEYAEIWESYVATRDLGWLKMEVATYPLWKQPEELIAHVFRASIHGSDEAVAGWLLSWGMVVDPSDDFAFVPIHDLIAYSDDDPTMLPFLLSHGADIERVRFGRRPLHEAASSGRVRWIRALIDCGAAVNATVPHDSAWTPLMLASRSGHYEAVVELVERGANLFATDGFCDETAWHFACEKHPQIRQYLAEKMSAIRDEHWAKGIE